MGFELPDGKTARNIQDQVKFLTEKLKDLYAAFNQSGLKKIEIVEELPEVGKPDVLYLLPVETPDDNNYYEEYLWLDDQWELIGTTQIDLSNYVTLDGEQTITGKKTFKDRFDLKSSSENHSYTVVGDTNGSLYFYVDAIAKALIGNDFKTNSVIPLSNNSASLGSGSYMWANAYVAGKINFDANGYSYVGMTSGSLSLQSNSGVISIFSQLRPSTNNTLDLGSSSYKWKDLYMGGTLHLGNNEIKVDQYDQLLFGTATGYPNLFYGAVMPRYDNTYNLGGTNFRFKNVYVSENLTDGTNSITVANIQSKVYRHVITGITLPSGFGGSSTLVVESKTAAAFATIGDLYDDCEAGEFRNFYILTIDQGNEVSRAPVIRLAPNGTNIELEALNITGGAVQVATSTIGSITTTITDTVSAL